MSLGREAVARLHRMMGRGRIIIPRPAALPPAEPLGGDMSDAMAYACAALTLYDHDCEGFEK